MGGGCAKGTLHALNSCSTGTHAKDTGRTRGTGGWRRPCLAVHSNE